MRRAAASGDDAPMPAAQSEPVIEVYFDYAEIEFVGEVVKIVAYSTRSDGSSVPVCRGITPRSGMYRTLFAAIRRLLPGFLKPKPASRQRAGHH